MLVYNDCLRATLLLRFFTTSLNLETSGLHLLKMLTETNSLGQIQSKEAQLNQDQFPDSIEMFHIKCH